MAGCRIDTAFFSPDPELAGSLTWISGLSVADPLRHEMLAHLHMVLARSHWRAADRLRQSERDRARRSAARRKPQPPLGVPGPAIPVGLAQRRSRDSSHRHGSPEPP